MNIERHLHKRKMYLTADSSIYFDDENAFCGRPKIHLIAIKNRNDDWWNDYQIGVSIHDMDDYDIGYIYTAKSEEQFFNVLHELINWMNDLEHGVCFYDEFVENISRFFPSLGCKKEMW